MKINLTLNIKNTYTFINIFLFKNNLYKIRNKKYFNFLRIFASSYYLHHSVLVSFISGCIYTHQNLTHCVNNCPFSTIKLSLVIDQLENVS